MAILELTFASGEFSLEVRRFDVHESISSLFSITIRARSPNVGIDLETIVESPQSSASGTAWSSRTGTRLGTGICSQLEQLQAETAGLSTYWPRVVPPVWLLTQRRNHRIYQYFSIPHIADEILVEWGVEHNWSIDRGWYRKLEYKFHYGESDYASSRASSKRLASPSRSRTTTRRAPSPRLATRSHAASSRPPSHLQHRARARGSARGLHDPPAHAPPLLAALHAPPEGWRDNAIPTGWGPGHLGGAPLYLEVDRASGE